MSMDKLKKAMDKLEQGGGAHMMGRAILQVAEMRRDWAEIIAEDIENKSMNFETCFTALRDHAKKNQKNGFWGCLFEPVKGNVVFDFIVDFYKLPDAAAAPAKSQALGVDLMDLL